jgi:hypothetical protein
MQQGVLLITSLWVFNDSVEAIGIGKQRLQSVFCKLLGKFNVRQQQENRARIRGNVIAQQRQAGFCLSGLRGKHQDNGVGSVIKGSERFAQVRRSG